MKLTEEQKEILSYQGDALKIEAGAGAGKTSILKSFAEKKPNEKFLYLCFNRSVRNEAESKFPKNVEVRTAHSLAYSKKKRDWKVMMGNLKCFDIVDILNLWDHKGETDETKYNHLKIAQHVLNKFSDFCNSSTPSLEEFDYAKEAQKFLPETLEFVESHIDVIDKGAQEIFTKMEESKMECTHDFYLKKYQLSNPKLNYDWIMYDEIQDANANMLDVFMKQNCKKIGVGDENQSVYLFRGAQNAFRILKGFDKLTLSNSFRFRQDIADLANHILDLKIKFGKRNDLELMGCGQKIYNDNKAVISRSNIGLFKRAIEIISDIDYIGLIDKIYFEGGFNNYIFSSDGGLWDIYNLFVGREVKNKFIDQFESFDELKEYSDSHGSRDLQLIIQLVGKFKTRLPVFYKKLKNKICENRDEADIIFTTLHKAKGLEYRQVEIVPDFISQDRLIGYDNDDSGFISEEINCLYVAATRAIENLVFPPDLLYNNSILFQSKVSCIIRETF